MGIKKIMEIIRRHGQNISDTDKKKILKYIEDIPEENDDSSEGHPFSHLAPKRTKRKKLSRYAHVCPFCKNKLEKKRTSLFCNECNMTISENDAIKTRRRRK